MPVHVSLNLDAPELQAFLAQGSSLKLAGAVKINGEATAQKGKYGGGFQIQARDLRADEMTVQNVDGTIRIADGRAQISKLDAVMDAKNRLSISGEAGLAAPFAYNLSLDLGFTDLSSFQPLLKKLGNDKALGGALEVKWRGNGEVQSNRHSGDGTLALTGGRFGDQRNLEANVAANYSPEKVDIIALRAAANEAEAKLAAHWDTKRLQIRDLTLHLQQAPVLQGTVDMPLDAAQLKDVTKAIPDDQPIKINLQSSEIDLKRLLQQLGQQDPAVTGSAELGVNVEGTLRDLLVKVSLRSWQLRAKSAPDLSPAGVLLDLQLKDKHVTLNGNITQPLVQAMKFSGDAPLDLSRIKTPAQILPPDQPLKFSFDTGQVDLNKLLRQLGQKDPALSGNGSVSIRLDGPMNALAGDVAVRGTKLQAKTASGLSPADVSLDLKLRDKKLTVDGHVTQPLVQAMKLTAAVPLDLGQLKNPDKILPSDQPLRFSFQSGEVDLKKLLLQLGQKEPPMTGKAQVDVEAGGTLANLAANVSVRGTGLQSPKAAKVAPAELALNLDLKDRRLKVDGSIRQSLIQPLAIKGDIPIDVQELRTAKALDPKTPLNLEVSLPKSSVAFVSSLVPSIRYIKGTAAIDVKVKGTIAAPDFGGAVESDLDNLRFVDPGLPPLNNAVLRINFTKDQVTINQFKSGSAGGTLGASGTIKFAKITEPVFDLKVVSNKALVRQDDNVTARVSSDLRIAGPLNAGTVSGTVFVTKSHFFKDIDILPIGLPGRPAPQPPPSAGPSVVSFPNPPLRDWKFDVTIKTSDPFLIQGNLADGKVTSDLHFGGTGLKPWLEGSARITHLTTSLPFSKLEISDGMVYFTQDAPFVPKLNIRGTSTIRDYNVTVSIYGTASAPQAVFSSVPPLPQSDVVALIATGTTTKELAGDPNALAGRAAFLVIQKYYHKWFGKKNESSKPDNSLLGNAQFDFGAVDPKTGKQSVAVRLPLGDHYAISGGLDVGGDFRGEVKYIMRFR
jgi:autotransporter translocation and assembly factor TamB